MNQAILQAKRLSIISVAVAVLMLMTLWQTVSIQAQTPTTNAFTTDLSGCIQPSIPYCHGGVGSTGSGLNQGTAGTTNTAVSISQTTNIASSTGTNTTAQVSGAPNTGGSAPNSSTAWYLILGALGLPLMGLSLRTVFGTNKS